MTTDSAWRAWGEIDPYYGVLTNEKFRTASLENNIGEFFQTGEEYVEQRLEKLERHFGHVARNRALDFGCGVGRLTLPLARRFDAVTGIDISPSMLVEAERNANREQLNNLQWGSSDDSLSAAVGKFDFVNTYIVLQHIPVGRGLAIIDALLDRVAPGGGISLHFSVSRHESLVRRGAYWAQRYVPGAQNVVNLVRRRRWDEPLMQMNPYPFPAIANAMARAGFAAFLVEPEQHGGILTVNMLARRLD